MFHFIFQIKSKHKRDLLIPERTAMIFTRQSVHLRSVVGKLAWKNAKSHGETLRGNNSLRKHGGWLNRVLTKLPVHKSIPFEEACCSTGGCNGGAEKRKCTLLIAQIPICRAARDTYAGGAVISNRRFSKVASATLLVKGSVIARQKRAKMLLACEDRQTLRESRDGSLQRGKRFDGQKEEKRGKKERYHWRSR